jgi:hypothetical protein
MLHRRSHHLLSSLIGIRSSIHLPSPSLICAVDPLPPYPHHHHTLRWFSNSTNTRFASTPDYSFPIVDITQQKRGTSRTPLFTPKPRTSSLDPVGGELAPAATSSSKTGTLKLSAAAKTQSLLNPQRLSRGKSARAAKMDKELHAHNKLRLNHSLAYHIERTKNWAELVKLLFDHMHHMTSHNWIRGSQRLVQLSPSRQLLDVDTYNQFGRVMVALEMQIGDMDEKGLMKMIFVPYHYLRQCLKQMRLSQEAALDREKADPEGTQARRHAERQSTLAVEEAELQTRHLEARFAATQHVLSERRSSSSGEEKDKKLRARERRAGRTFISVEDTLRKAGSTGSAFKPTGPKRNKPRPKFDD